MMVAKRILALLALFVATGATLAEAQNNTGSPYSVYGFGMISENPGQYTSMGGVSAAMRDNININYLNPASYTALDSNRIHVQLGVNANFSKLSTSLETAHYKMAQNTAFCLGFRIWKDLYASVGFTELSDIGYDLIYTNWVPGSTVDKYTQHLFGEGGINQFHIGAAWRYKNLSIGANFGVVFGKIEKRQTLGIPLDGAYSLRSSDINHIHDILITFGAQYEFPFAGNQRLILGTDFNFNSKFYTKQSYAAYKISTTSSTTIEDTDPIRKGFITYPFRITSGLSWAKGTKWLAAGDYTFQKMSTYKEYGVVQKFHNYHRVAVGASFTPEKYSRKWGKRNSYDFGGYMVRSHIRIEDKYINTYALTAGMMIPFLNTSARHELDLRFSIDWGMRGTEAHKLIREQFVMLRANIAFKEVWFLKRKIN